MDLAELQYGKLPLLEAKIVELEKKLKSEKRLRLFITLVLALNIAMQFYLLR